jgi:two-component system cell cycle response regulator
LRILIADDDSISRKMVGSSLKSAGFEVMEAADGGSALAVLTSEEGPRLALLDWMMPGTDGPSVCREVRKRRVQPYVYMVLLTQKERKDDVVEGLESGADDYLVKPFHPAELTARLRAGQRILELEDKLVQAREEMRFRATHDALTSLWNRGFVLDMLARELDRARRERSSISLLLCDADHFKNINDQHGHAIGDEVLREIARRLLGSVRSYDFVGRYGGEEFLVILNGCDAIRGRDRAEQIRSAVAQRPVLTARGPVPVTLSIGVVASCDWERIAREQLLQEADAALYQAKAAGRNRVVLVQPEAAGMISKRSPALTEPER